MDAAKAVKRAISAWYSLKECEPAMKAATSAAAVPYHTKAQKTNHLICEFKSITTRTPANRLWQNVAKSLEWHKLRLGKSHPRVDQSMQVANGLLYGDFVNQNRQWCSL